MFLFDQAICALRVTQGVREGVRRCHLPWARRVLIVGQYKSSNSKDDFVQESNAENAEPCTVIMH